MAVIRQTAAMVSGNWLWVILARFRMPPARNTAGCCSHATVRQPQRRPSLPFPRVLQLVHHGVRCAHLYLAQSQSELPGLLSAVTAAQELRAANRQVGGRRTALSRLTARREQQKVVACCELCVMC